MKLAFYKAFQKKATALDKVIAVATMGKYSHVEMVFSEGYSFSISPRDGGARYKEIDFDPNSWDLFELPVTRNQEKTIKNHIKVLYLNKKYDTIGAIFSALPFCIQNPTKIFCSEVAVNLLNVLPMYVLGNGCRYSPNGLYRKLNRNKDRFKPVQL